MSRIQVGVAGLGYWGPNLVRVLSESAEFNLVCVHDVREQSLAKIASRYPGLRATTSYEEMLSLVDAVVIATPIGTHHALSKTALNGGKHVFVEKPLTHSVATAKDLVLTAASQECILQAGHVFVYTQPVRHIKKMLDEKELGEIYFISSSRVNLGLFQKDVSVIWDLAVHDFSILNYWFQKSPVKVQATGRDCLNRGIFDVAFITADYGDGKLANVEVSWLAPTKLRRMVIAGEKRMVVYDDTSPDEKVRVFDRGVIKNEPTNFGEYNITYRMGNMFSPYLDNREPLRLELEQFSQSIRSGKPPEADGVSGLQVVCALEAAQKSAEQGSVAVHVEDTTRELKALANGKSVYS